MMVFCCSTIFIDAYYDSPMSNAAHVSLYVMAFMQKLHAVHQMHNMFLCRGNGETCWTNNASFFWLLSESYVTPKLTHMPKYV